MADPFRPHAGNVAYLIYSPGTDLLSLIEEAIALLPPSLRWQVTFDTYFTELPVGVTCAWRGVVAGTAAAEEARRWGDRALLIDLTCPSSPAPAGAAAEAARQGTLLSTERQPTGGDSSQYDVRLASGPRRRLTPAPPPPLVAKVPQTTPLAESSSIDELEPEPEVRPVSPHGSQIWLFVGVGITCLAIGIAIGYGVAFVRMSEPTQAEAPHARPANAVANTPATEPAEASLPSTRPENLQSPPEPDASEASDPINPTVRPRPGSETR